MKRTFRILAAAILVTLSTVAACAQTPTSYNAGIYQWTAKVLSGNTATGSGTTVTVVGAPGQNGPQLANGTVIPWSTIFQTLTPVWMNDANAEVVTPTSVSVGPCNGGNLGIGSATCATITGNFTLTHGQSGIVQEGSGGAQTAVNYAFLSGGGVVTIDNGWAGGVNTGATNAPASANAALTALTPFASVNIEDRRNGFAQAWQPTQTLATVLAVPTTLTSSTVGFGLNGANTASGTYTGASTYHYCEAYVDPMGNEGPCSADFSAATAGTGTTNQIGFAAPAASTGAVGYIPYISLGSGSYNLTYQVPLTSSVCALTKIETTTPACAVTNTNYGQTGSAAIVSALTVNTAPLHLLKTTASTTSAYIGTPSGRTAYAYAPVGTTSAQGLTYSQQGFTIAPAAATTIPEVVATIPVPVGQMNFVGRTLCVEGQANIAANGTTATIQNLEFLWDAAGSNTAGAPVIIGQLQITATGAGSLQENYGFHECFQTTVSGTSVTAGSITGLGGLLNYVEGAGTLHAAGTDVLDAAAVASLNLAGTGGNTQRLHVVWLHTTGTDSNGMQVTALRAYWQ